MKNFVKILIIMFSVGTIFDCANASIFSKVKSSFGGGSSSGGGAGGKFCPDESHEETVFKNGKYVHVCVCNDKNKIMKKGVCVAADQEGTPIKHEEIIVPEPEPQPEPNPVIPDPTPQPEPNPVIPEPTPQPEPNPVIPDPLPEPEPEPIIEPDCYYTFNATVKCANGNSYSGYHTVKLSKQELGDDSCETFNKRFASDAGVAMKYFDKLCSQYVFGSRQPDALNNTTLTNDTKLTNAKNALDKFFKSVESNRSGLKTADGKFNTVRLASDISAGVVLGTIGGVVSGVVIKKKQVEKGFEALHCTVGGQKIADWGDEFTVGLQR